MPTFEDLLEKVKDLKKNYEPGQIKINVPATMALIMSGAMDSLFGKALSVQERLDAIKKFKDAANSEAALPSSRTDSIGMNEIDSEFTRNLWVSAINPLHMFKICDHYRQALESMGFVDTKRPNMRYRKLNPGVGGAIDVFGSWKSLNDPRAIRIYSSKNNRNQPAIVAIYKGYETKTFGAGRKYRKLKFHDGSSLEEGLMWPERNSSSFDRILEMKLESAKGKPCLVIGRMTFSAKGYRSFMVTDVIPFY